MDLYVRQFRDMKVIPSGEEVAPWLWQFARKCGRVLARAHATTGDAVAIDAYLGKGGAFDAAMLRFAQAYAAFRTTGTTPSSSPPSPTASSTARQAGDVAAGHCPESGLLGVAGERLRRGPSAVGGRLRPAFW